MRNDPDARMFLPYEPPRPPGSPLPAIPALWEKAAQMFARVIEHIGSTSSFAKRWRISRRDRAELVNWLAPVERLVRACIVTNAITFLLETVKGRKLLRETPKMASPEPPKPPGKKSRHSIQIPHPGWHTIAQHVQPAPKLEAPPLAPEDPFDPASWGANFRVLGWKFHANDERKPPKKKRRLFILSLDPEPEHYPSSRRKHEPLRKDQQDPPALILARRIESLRRIIANPGPAISRTARFIARYSSDLFNDLSDAIVVSPRWFHGYQAIRDAREHVASATATLGRPLEPG